MSNPSRDLSYPRFFNAAELGKSLKEVATDYIATGSQKIITRWFHSSKDADLYIWLDTNQNIIKQQISFYGQVVEWNVIEGLRTGVLVEFEENGSVAPSEVIQFDSKPQVRPVEQAVSLLGHVAGLNEPELTALLDNFNSARTGINLPDAEFVERFAAFLGDPNPKPPQRTSFWRWLRRFFS